MKQIRIENISKDFMTQEVFSNLSFTVSEKQRIALVGPNGAGKSTLMKCLMGHEDISSGIIGVDDNMRIGYLAQVHPHTGQTIYDLMQASFEEVYQYWKTIKETEDKLDDPEQYDRWEKASSQYENMGGFKNEITIEKVLTQINFPKERWNDLCTNLSGGQRVRLAFGQILCQKPDFLLLDEPTNFLDIESIEWLEDYLINTWKG
ncbi:MAG: ATP-binding cassette domain-containing protein [Patescibacteria group bacterium]|nr:ATP-binding cassette domain-containing protein [Patescibacteria group bacterium]